MRVIFTLAAIAALSTSPAVAGGLAQPAVDPEVVMNPDAVAGQTVGSGGFIVPLVLLAVIVAAASNSGGGGSAPVAAPPLKRLK